MKTLQDVQNEILNGSKTIRQIVDESISSINDTKDYNAVLRVYSSAIIDECILNAEKMFKEKSHTSLTGVPIIIKDNICVKGEIVTAASKMLENYIAPYDASVISKLKKAGAIIIASANLDEFAMGSSTENSAFGPTLNPFDKQTVAGGTSGGSTASVALGNTVVALGSDTGGSIRQPASFCGVVGLKPTYGRVSRSGLIAMSSSLDQIGPVANTVNDAFTIYNIIKGKDSLDATTVEIDDNKVVNVKKKIGVPFSFINKDGIDQSIKADFESSLKEFESLGYEIVDVSLPSFDKALAMYYIVCPAEVSSNMGRYDGVRYGASAPGKTHIESFSNTRSEFLGPEVKRRILVGTYVLSSGYYDAYYNKAEKARDNVRNELNEVFKTVDVIATPVSPVLPWKIGEKADPMSMYLADVFTVPVNIAGNPSIAIPTKRKLGAFKGSIQLIAPHFGENILHRLSTDFEGLQR